MPLALTCDCGGRFEVDEQLAGQTVSCPECLQPLQAPAQASSPRPDLLAIASLVLVLLGAFTVVGTVLGVLVGVMALLRILQQPDRRSGVPIAGASIILGAGLTAATWYALAAPALVPVGGWLRSMTMANQIHTGGSIEVVATDGSCSIQRPSTDWGRVEGEASNDPAVADLQRNADAPIRLDLLLACPLRRTYLDVQRDGRGRPGPLSLYGDHLLPLLDPPRRSLMGREDENPEPRNAPPRVRRSGPLPPLDGKEGYEWVVDLERGAQVWRFIVRIYRKQNPDPRGTDPIFVLRGYCPLNQFSSNEADLKQALDSVRFLR